MEHTFTGNWITTGEFACLPPRNVFVGQLERVTLPCEEHRDRHILFRREFKVDTPDSDAAVYISADDYYKLYINGEFVAQGPAPAYHFRYNYNKIPIGKYLKSGKNLIAVHTLYQGLVNRVWQSGDNRHGLIFDLVCDGKTVICSDESVKTALHTAYTESGTVGYDTQFLETYDSNAPEVGFQSPEFDDSAWQKAVLRQFADYTLYEQKSYMLTFERFEPVKIIPGDGRCFYDFGANRVGTLDVTARGKKGAVVTIRCGQELNDDGSVRFDLRANCRYEEKWILSDKECRLDWFDYKCFRYAELLFDGDTQIESVSFRARHYPFKLKPGLKREFADHEDLKKIWELCVNTQRYGVQEVIQDCMEREKGFYLGDGCYTVLENMILTGDDTLARKLIDDAFATDFITDTLVTCMDCSFMQEIAEFPLILVFLVLWHYRLTGDREYLAGNFPKVTKLLDAYRRRYEQGGLLRNLDKWCVVEWPKNFQHDYDVDIREGQVCRDAHVAINAYYIEAVRTANRMACVLGKAAYRDEKPLLDIFQSTFYDPKAHLFKDGENTEHISLVGNSFVYGFDLCPDEECRQSICRMIETEGLDSLSLFCVFPVMMGFVKNGREDLVKRSLLLEGCWKRMLREDATATFEGWGKDTKWNTSLFHLTMSYAAVFMADIDTRQLFCTD